MPPEPIDDDCDGCTLFPDGVWYDCCRAHDYAYRAGGGFWERRRADLELMRCVAAMGYPLTAKFMFLGVRLFGWVPWLGHRFCVSFLRSEAARLDQPPPPEE